MKILPILVIPIKGLSLLLFLGTLIPYGNADSLDRCEVTLLNSKGIEVDSFFEHGARACDFAEFNCQRMLISKKITERATDLQCVQTYFFPSTSLENREKRNLAFTRAHPYDLLPFRSRPLKYFTRYCVVGRINQDLEELMREYKGRASGYHNTPLERLACKRAMKRCEREFTLASESCVVLDMPRR